MARSEWHRFIDKQAPKPGKMRSFLQQLSREDRAEFVPWIEHVREMNSSSITADFFIKIMSSSAMTVFGSCLLIAGLTALIIGSCVFTTLPVSAALAASVGTGLVALSIFSRPDKNEQDEDPTWLSTHDDNLFSY